MDCNSAKFYILLYLDRVNGVMLLDEFKSLSCDEKYVEILRCLPDLLPLGEQFYQVKIINFLPFRKKF